MADFNFAAQAVNAAIAVLWTFLGILLYAMGCLSVLKIWDWVTKDIDEIEEIKKNNTAVAMLFSSLILGMAYVLVNVMKP